MILIADSGTTKTEWRIIDQNGKITQTKSEGVNPYYMSASQISEIFEEGLSDHLNSPFEAIYFYGAGCSSDKNKRIISACLQILFPNARIEVDHDLLAAARSLCGAEKGIACILGTGSNSCLYDGHTIIDNVMSLGYLLGDEGSGNYIGRQLLTHYLKSQLPEIVKQHFDKRFGLQKHEILENIYRSNLPARYFAGFSKFVFQNIHDPFLYKMVYDGFKTFLEANVIKYKDYQQIPIHFTGSVAFYYSNILRQAGTDLGLSIRHIVEGPIAGLTLFYQKN